MSATEPQGVIEHLREIFIPTTSKKYRDKKQGYKVKHEEQLDEVRKEVKQLKRLVESSRKTRLAMLRMLGSQAEFTGNLGREEEIATVRKSLMHLDSSATLTNSTVTIKAYCEVIQQSETLTSHLKAVQKNLNKFEHRIATQACADWTSYRGLKDWGETIFETCSYVMKLLVTTSTVGAGLAYTTTFSAVRGDVGMMAFTFPLFCCGFLVPVCLWIVLKWASTRRSDVEFASQTFWTAVIKLFLFISALGVVVAVILLNITVFTLRSDSNLFTDTVPRTPGIVIFAFAGLFFLVLLGAITLTIFAKGFGAVSAVFMARENDRSSDSKSLKDFEFV